MDRLYFGEVVKPTWLFTITWIVPPVRYPCSWLRFSVSATTPWPANAASPCMSSGSTANLRSGSFWSCLARTMPSSTGLTASRWLGLAARYTLTSEPSSAVNVPSVPRWYLTSPEPWTLSTP